MVRLSGRLSSLKVANAREPGMLADGDGLYLQVTRGNSRSWIFRYFRNGKSHEMGLGSLKAVGLAAARSKAAECRAILADGVDPIAARDAERAQRTVEDARGMTFDSCADAYIKAHSSAWKNEKHVAQWKATIRTYVSPVFGSLPVQAVDVALVMKVLEPIWTGKPETAGRIRGRIESVLNWAKARGYRTGENPALWKGHLDNLLPARSKIAKVKHHAALPYDQTSQFIDSLRRQDGVAPLALEFAILTAARTGEVIGARWDEIDLAQKVWTVPASRMKGGREHRVPLSADALYPELKSDEQALIQDVVRRFLRTPLFVGRYFDVHARSGERALQAAFGNKDISGIALGDKIDAFLKFIAKRCFPLERAQYLDALNRMQPGMRGELQVEKDDDLSLLRGVDVMPNIRLANGLVAQETRQRLMLAFNTPFFPEVLVASKVLSEGVNLHLNCRYLIHHDLSWNPSTLEQRTGRVDRIGAKAEVVSKPVEVFMPYIGGTQDEKQYRVVMDRERWFQVLMGEEYRTDEFNTEVASARVPLPVAAAEALAFDLSVKVN